MSAIEVQGVVVGGDESKIITAAVVQPAQPQLMNVQIPQGVTSGMTIVVQSPEGVQFQVQVPQGVSSGQTIQVQPPAPSGMVVQQPQMQQPVVQQQPQNNGLPPGVKETDLIPLQYCGPISCCIAIICLPAACCIPMCPCDTKMIVDPRRGKGNHGSVW
jgi:hypothetical protein